MTGDVSRALLARLVGALLSEGLLTAAPTADGHRRIELGRVRYELVARAGAFGTSRVDPVSIRRIRRGVLGEEEAEPATDPAVFLTDAAEALRLDGATLANYLAELNATLAADVEIARKALPAAEVVGLPHAQVEGHLTGHPLLVANKGRVGFSRTDRERYAPEARRPLRPVWLAVSRQLAELRCVPSLSEEAVLTGELDRQVRERFRTCLTDAGVDPAGHLLLPAHPWQVDHVVHQLWAPSVARREVVVLGEATDDYLPTQSIRTLVNVTSRSRHQVKLPLQVLNTSVYRGIPRHCSLHAPLVTHWLRGIWDGDPQLHERAVLLGEVASVTVHHPQLADAEVPYQWDETLGCIWREPVDAHLLDGETVWPLALLLHVDPSGATAVAELVRRSAGPAEEWLERLVAVVLRPLLYLLHTYGISVNPHGENLMVTCGPDGLPARLVVKDLVDDVNLSAEPVPQRTWEPDGRERVLPRKPWHVLRQYLVDALLLGVWEPLSALLDAGALDVEGDLLWRLTRREVERYASRHPEQSDRIAATGLLEAEVARHPLNGYRLSLGYTDLVDRPPVPRTGTIPNPLHHAGPQVATPPAPPRRGPARRAG